MQDAMDTDAHLMARVQRGETAAFERLVQQYTRPLYAFFIRLAGSVADAEDLVQETFLRVYKVRGTFDTQRALTPWIYGIAAHVWADYGRKRGSVQATMDRVIQELGTPEAGEVSDVGDQAARRDIARHVREAIQQLPEEHRLVLILRHYHGLSYADVGQALGISVGTVKSRLHYALARLRAGLQRRGLLEA
jgi:RNA polymerase sigma-70 factor (ECF subfamily)